MSKFYTPAGKIGGLRHPTRDACILWGVAITSSKNFGAGEGPSVERR